MKVLIKSLSIQNPGGPRTVAMNLFRDIFRIDQENQYCLLLSNPEPALLSHNVQQHVIPIKNRFLSRIWLQWSLPGLAKSSDVVHFSKNLGVFGLNKPYVVTVLDLTTLLHPEIMPRSDVLYWKYLQPITLKRAAQVITISNNAAEDIHHIYHIPKEKIHVTYPGIADYFHPAGETETSRVREKYHLPNLYILHVGRIDPKKNLTTLVEAFALLKKFGFDGKLVFVGEYYQKKPDVRLKPLIEALNLKDQVIFTGRVPDEDLAPLYSGAFASVFPSLHEGFGLVAAEALACGTALITHQAGAVGEVVANCAIVVDTPTPEAICDSLQRLLEEPELRQELRMKGPVQAKNFSWLQAAEQTLQIYKKAARV